MTDSLLDLAQRIITALHLEDITPAEIDSQQPLFGGGLGLDSIDALELAVMVERSYGVRIPDAAAGRDAFASLAALHQFIQANRKTEPNTPRGG